MIIMLAVAIGFLIIGGVMILDGIEAILRKEARGLGPIIGGLGLWVLAGIAAYAGGIHV